MRPVQLSRKPSQPHSIDLRDVGLFLYRRRASLACPSSLTSRDELTAGG